MMTSKIELIEGIPTIVVNDNPLMEMAYITYRPDCNRYTDFADTNVRLFSVNLNFSEMPINERAPVLVFQKGIFEQDPPDFGIVDRNFDQILDACPNAYIFPRVNVNLPRQWEEQHPMELCEKGFGDRTRFSYASDLWLETVRTYLTKLICYIEQSKYKDRVIGYQLAAGNTEEWLAIDPQAGFGVRAKEKFDGYCKKHNLPQTQENYYKFMSETVVSCITSLAATVKNMTDHRKLVGCFYGYTLFVGRDECHNALKMLLESENVDFLCSPLCYADLRTPGIDLYPMVPTASVRHHQKLYFAENDIRTHLSRSIHDHPNYTSAIWYGPEKNLAAEQLKLAFCRAMLYGHGMWWFDMWGGWYDDEDYMELINRMSTLCQKGMDTPDSEVAVYVDEESVIKDESANVLMGEAMKNLGLCGTPYDIYLASDFSQTFQNYRACIFIEPVQTPLSCACAREANAAAIPVLSFCKEVPNPKKLQQWLCGVGIIPPVDRPAVVYRGKRFICLYTPEDGKYDFCDGGKHTFTDLFENRKIQFPTLLPKGKLFLFEREIGNIPDEDTPL